MDDSAMDDSAYVNVGDPADIRRRLEEVTDSRPIRNRLIPPLVQLTGEISAPGRIRSRELAVLISATIMQSQIGDTRRSDVSGHVQQSFELLLRDVLLDKIIAAFVADPAEQGHLRYHLNQQPS